MTSEPKKIPHKKHDLGYKYLLSFVEFFQQLIEGFVDETWKDQLDFSRAEKIDKEYVLKDFREIESDVLYKIPLGKSDEAIYLYILVELQSTVDHSIAFRVLVYLVNIWQDLYSNMKNSERKKKSFSLPPVFPIVLYNGSKEWKAATSVKELVEKGELFQDFLPNVHYHLVDVSEQGIEKLKELANSLAAVFLLEKEDSATDWRENFKIAVEWFSKENNAELWKVLIHWLAYHSESKLGSKDGKKMLDQIDFEQHSKQEISTMIETLPNRLIEQGKKEGMLETLSWTSPELAKKYRQEVLSAKTESELSLIKEKIKSELQQR